jgi:lysozyme
MDTCNVTVDISHLNTNVDLNRVQAAGVEALLHKATQGAGFTDSAYASRRAAAKDLGLLWGAYHFGTGDDPVAQAQFFLSVASPASQDRLCWTSKPTAPIRATP